MPIGDGTGAVRLIDVSGNTIQLDTSGRITIAGGSITASVSGDTVIAKISGETISTSISGNTVTAKVSGETVSVASGARVILINAAGTAAVFTAMNLDSNSATFSGPVVGSMGYGFREGSTSGWARLRVTESGQGMSGINYKLAVDFSGAVATISGNVNYYFGPAIRTAATTVITNASGGTQLSSGAVTSVMVKNRISNTSMWIHSSGQAASGVGYEIEPGEAVPFPVNNFNVLWLAASTSGQYVSFYGVST